jgi:hypothetical protein
MKKVSLNRWLLAASVVALSFSCQSKKMTDKPGTQCEEPEDHGYGTTSHPADEEDEEEMSSLSQEQNEEKAAVDPAQNVETISVQQVEPPESTAAPAPSEPLSIQSAPVEFIPELDLETLAKMFSIEAEAAQTPAASSDSDTK